MIPNTANAYIKIRVAFLKEDGVDFKDLLFLNVSEQRPHDQGAEHPLLGRQGCQGLMVSADFPLKRLAWN